MIEMMPLCAFSPFLENGKAKPIDQIEGLLLERPQVDFQTKHHFAPGIYAREITIPEGAMLTGAEHKTEHLNVISEGEILVFTEGEGSRVITAPFTFVSKPGARRVGYAKKKTVWTTIHPTTEKDLSKIEEALVHNPEKLQTRKALPSSPTPEALV